MAVSALIVDDHAGFRSFAAALLREEGFDVAGEAVDGATPNEATLSPRPDVVLLDVQLPDADDPALAALLT